MDPNVTLQAIRDYVRMIQTTGDLADPDDGKAQEILSDLAEELANAAGNLDKWLTNGGHLPGEWDDAPRGWTVD